MSNFGIDLESHFSNEDTYTKFKDDLDLLFSEICLKYSFLGFKERSWQKNFQIAISRHLNALNIADISTTLENAINAYIKRQIAANNTKILDRMLIEINQEYKHKSYQEILKIFFRKLEVDNIIINEEYYTHLKQDSKILKKYLERLGIYDLSLKETITFFNKKDDVYDKFMKVGYSYQERKKLLDYILSFFKETVKEELLQNIINENTKKIRLFWSRYDEVLKIHELFKKHIGQVDDKLIDKVILNYSYFNLHKLFESYRRYRSLGNDLSFINLIANQIGFNNIIFNNPSASKNSPIKQDSKPQPIAVSNNPKPSSKPKKTPKTRAISDNSDTASTPKKVSITPSKDFFTNSATFNAILCYFPVQEGMTEEERNQIAEILFKEEDSETKDIIIEKLSKTLNSKDKRYRKFYKAIKRMQNKYNRYGKELLDPSFKIPKKSRRRSSIYKYFPIKKGMNENDRNRIIAILIQNLSLKKQSLITAYIDQKTSLKETPKILNIIKTLQNQYNDNWSYIIKFASLKDLRKYELYNRFRVFDDINEEIRNQIVDFLISKMTEEQQELYNSFLEGKYSNEDQEFKNLMGIINYLIEVYLHDYKKILLPGYTINLDDNLLNLYPLFPIGEGMTILERNKIVSIIFYNREPETQDLIIKYLKGEMSNQPKLSAKARNQILSMDRTYKNFGRLILTPYYNHKAYSKTIKASLGIKETMSQEEQNKIIDKCIHDYEVSTLFNNIITLIKTTYGIALDNLNENKKEALYNALKVIEYIYREKFKTPSDEYQAYFNKRIIELFTENSSSLEALIVAYINDEYKVIKSRERKV